MKHSPAANGRGVFHSPLPSPKWGVFIVGFFVGRRRLGAAAHFALGSNLPVLGCGSLICVGRQVRLALGLADGMIRADVVGHGEFLEPWHLPPNGHRPTRFVRPPFAAPLP